MKTLIKEGTEKNWWKHSPKKYWEENILNNRNCKYMVKENSIINNDLRSTQKTWLNQKHIDGRILSSFFQI